MQYGLPYKGSKSRIADKIIGQLPPAGTLYDLFAGGCAISHAALESGKWGRVVANDITPYPGVFKKAVAGEYRDLRPWLGRDEFFQTQDPLLRLIFSFGNDCRTYLYAEAIIPFKKACHDALVNGDFEGLKDLGYDCTPLALYGDFEGKRMALKRILLEQGAGNGNLEHLERLGRVQHLERLGRVQHLESSQKDYRDVEIDSDSVIYCDVPYKGTNGYGKTKKSDFDSDSFYDWALRQTVPVFISEYQMPDEFECIWESRIKSSICQYGPMDAVERLFVPRGQGGGQGALF